MRLNSTPPTIIQGGMGIAVSNWRLARAVSQLGEIGIVSATCIDSVMVRDLQEGDPHGRLEILANYPDQEIVELIRKRYFVEEGIDASAPYKLLPIHRFNPTVLSQRILCAATYTEVRLAKDGHEGYVGINLLCELKRHTLPCIYGAMLAEVDGIMIGAGIPKEEAEQVPLLAAGEKARLRLEVDTSLAPDAEQTWYYEFDPANILADPPSMKRPDFYPIIASDALARILDKKLPEGLITGWIIEGPVAGGHNAPPRNKKRDDDGHPIYDKRDIANLDRVSALGYPYYLAGGYATPEKYAEALEKGAAGIQVGSLFSLAEESGYPAAFKKELITRIHQKEISVRTDGKISPTGFPFKVIEVENTLGLPELYEERVRHCDLGYLQKAYLDQKGRILGRCPSEPVDDYINKGGKLEETPGKGCLCNGLFANIGMGQEQKWGKEKPLFTGGDALADLPLGSLEKPSYKAEEVITYLKAGRPSEISGDGSAVKQPFVDAS